MFIEIYQASANSIIKADENSFFAITNNREQDKVARDVNLSDIRHYLFAMQPMQAVEVNGRWRWPREIKVPIIKVSHTGPNNASFSIPIPDQKEVEPIKFNGINSAKIMSVSWDVKSRDVKKKMLIIWLRLYTRIEDSDTFLVVDIMERINPDLIRDAEFIRTIEEFSIFDFIWAAICYNKKVNLEYIAPNEIACNQTSYNIYDDIFNFVGELHKKIPLMCPPPKQVAVALIREIAVLRKIFEDVDNVLQLTKENNSSKKISISILKKYAKELWSNMVFGRYFEQKMQNSL